MLSAGAAGKWAILFCGGNKKAVLIKSAPPFFELDGC
jgi:hypothetical protein